MLKKLAIHAAIGVALGAGAVGAQAATMQLNSWTWGKGNPVNASAPTYSGVGGGFTGTLSGAVPASLNGAIDTYCVELTESFSFNTSYANYTVLDAASYFNTAYSSATKAATLGKLISYVYDNNLFGSTAAGFKDDQSTALQLAIWNVVYDDDLTLSSGKFKDSSAYGNNTDNFLGANQLLDLSKDWKITYDLYVLSAGKPINTGSGNQDQLFWRHTVPEPTSLALVALALGAAGLSARRRKPAA
jgi:hypothetical protein